MFVQEKTRAGNKKKDHRVDKLELSVAIFDQGRILAKIVHFNHTDLMRKWISTRVACIAHRMRAIRAVSLLMEG